MPVQFPGTQEPLFADTEVHYYGQPLGLVLADSYQLAVRAAKEVEVEYDSEGLQPITTIKAALQGEGEPRGERCGGGTSGSQLLPCSCLTGDW